MPGAGALALFPVKSLNKIKGHRQFSLLWFLLPQYLPYQDQTGDTGVAGKGVGESFAQRNYKLIKTNSINSMLPLTASFISDLFPRAYPGLQPSQHPPKPSQIH